MCCEWLPVVRDIVAIGGVVITAIKVHAELGAWRKQKRETTRAEVAGEAMIAAIRFVEHTKAVRNPARFTSGEDERDNSDREERLKRQGEALAAQQLPRWTELDATSGKAFTTAWEKARVYLPDAASVALEAIWKKKVEIWASQLTLTNSWQNGHADLDLFNLALHPKLDGELDGLAEAAGRILKPLATLES